MTIDEARQFRRVLNHTQRIDRELNRLEIVERCECLLWRSLGAKRARGTRPQINPAGKLGTLTDWLAEQRRKWHPVTADGKRLAAEAGR
ncbi:MAG: hypothetical protein A3E01_02920 [Gammaproteobacteria bacterium RIFCSPHIGHO2_12_FULL_63_22]|nr:MAG: hypothetical protein A3E01_02920 [Gammaproteobacteria bacterium RIFCSPHIGHO2_12_FULL_63_22]